MSIFTDIRRTFSIRKTHRVFQWCLERLEDWMMANEKKTSNTGYTGVKTSGWTGKTGIVMLRKVQSIITLKLEVNTEPDRQWRSSSFQEFKKVRVSRDLWPWPWPWAHPGCKLTRSPSCASLVAIRPFVYEKKRFAQKFTDGQTDGRTDDGRRAIALAHSWNELKTCRIRHEFVLVQLEGARGWWWCWW